MGIFRNCCLLFPTSFKLAQIGSFHMLHPLPSLITFNIAWQLKRDELNKCCEVLSICNSLHIKLHLICSVVCCTLPCHASLNRTCIIFVFASCHVYVVVVYYVVCLFPGCFSHQLRFRSGVVRICSTTSWTRSSSLRNHRQDDHTLEITSIFACQLFALLLCHATYHLLYHASHIAMSSL